MKTTNHEDQGHITQFYHLKENSIVKAVLYTDNSADTVRYYLKYYHNDIEISREIFDIYKYSLQLEDGINV